MRILIVLLLLIAAGAVVATQVPHPAGGTVPGTLSPVTLANTDSGRPVTLHVGQELFVRLKDRSWTPPAVDPKVLQVVPINEMFMRGVIGWNYRAIAPGATTFTTMGSCLPAPSGISCMSIVRYQVPITVLP